MAETSAKTIIDTGDLAQIEAGRRLVVHYLEETRALERSLVTNLKAHIAITPPGDYRSRLERHLDETRAHAGNLGQRLEALSAHTSLMAVGSGIAQTIAGQAVVMAKGPIDMVRSASGEERLLKNAKDEAAAEALEIATYDALEEAAKAVGDEETAKLAAGNRRDEETMLADLRKLIPDLTRARGRRPTTGESTYDISRTPAAKRARSRRTRRARRPVGGIDGPPPGQRRPRLSRRAVAATAPSRRSPTTTTSRWRRSTAASIASRRPTSARSRRTSATTRSAPACSSTPTPSSRRRPPRKEELRHLEIPGRRDLEVLGARLDHAHAAAGALDEPGVVGRLSEHVVGDVERALAAPRGGTPAASGSPTGASGRACATTRGPLRPP